MLEKSYGEVLVDYRGRLYLPAKLRDDKNLYSTYFEVVADTETDDIMLIKKRTIEKQCVCVMCGAKNVAYKELNGKHICTDCYNSL